VNDRSAASSHFSVNDRSGTSNSYKVEPNTGGSSQFEVNDRSMGSDALGVTGGAISIGGHQFKVGLDTKSAYMQQMQDLRIEEESRESTDFEISVTQDKLKYPPNP